MSKVLSVVLFFTATAFPTAVELAQVARLETVFRNVKVRDGSAAAADLRFSGGLEAFDFLAGPNIPAAYSSVEGAVTIAVPSAVNPDQFKVFPATLAVDASNADVQQLAAVKAVITNGLAAMTDITTDATVAWASSDATKATVGAATGIVTAVAAGSTTVTATLTAGTAVTAGAIAAATDLYTKAAHGFTTGLALKLVSLTGGTGLTAGTTYYFINTKLTGGAVDPDTGKLASSYANAIAGTAVDVTVDATSVVLVAAPVTSTCVVTVAA